MDATESDSSDQASGEKGRSVLRPMDARWLDSVSELRDGFRNAAPFPLVVLDGFLESRFVSELIAEFPALEVMPRSQDYVFGNKRELSSIEDAGTASALLYAMLTSNAFARWLGELTGWDLFVDPRFHGGGFHQGGDGSFLDMHVDFNVHPLHDDWLRMLNILLYLNPDWDESWGGHLLVKSHVEDEPLPIAPLCNRLVVMQTAAHTYHGYRRMSLPPGVTRRSIAAYAYRRIDDGAVEPRTTGWAPEEASLPKRLLARHYAGLVRIKNRWLGSGTAANR